MDKAGQEGSPIPTHMGARSDGKAESQVHADIITTCNGRLETMLRERKEEIQKSEADILNIQEKIKDTDKKIVPQEDLEKERDMLEKKRKELEVKRDNIKVVRNDLVKEKEELLVIKESIQNQIKTPKVHEHLIATCSERLQEIEWLLREREEEIKKSEAEILNIQEKWKDTEKRIMQMEKLVKKRNKLEIEKRELEMKSNNIKVMMGDLIKQMKKYTFLQENIEKPINDPKTWLPLWNLISESFTQISVWNRDRLQVHTDVISTYNESLEEFERIMREEEKQKYEAELLSIQKKKKDTDKRTLQMQNLKKESSQLESERKELERKMNNLKVEADDLVKEMKRLTVFKEIKNQIKDKKVCAALIATHEESLEQTEKKLEEREEEIQKCKAELQNIQKKSKVLENRIVEMEELEKEWNELENEKKGFERERENIKVAEKKLAKKKKEPMFFRENIDNPINDPKGIRSSSNRYEQEKGRQSVELMPEMEENTSNWRQSVPKGILKNVKDSAKGLQNIKSKLKMEKYRGRKRTLCDILQISPESLTNKPPQTTEDLLWSFLRKLMALNGTARSTNLKNRAFYDQIRPVDKEELDIQEDFFSGSNINTSDSLHPLDVLCATLLFSDSFLQQEILSKMSMCQFALPLLLPALDTSKCTLMLWAMRDIVRKWRPHSLAESRGFREEILVLTKMPTISFVRMGTSSFSKSQLLNEVLSSSQQYHDFFIHRDMESGNIPREIADGLVEISWYFPVGRENSDVFPEPIAVTNLRGDIESHWLQFSFLTEISSAVFIVTESISEKEYMLLSSLQGSATQYYFIFDSQAGKAKETLGFLKKLAPVLKINNSHILRKGSITNKAEFVKCLQEVMAGIMNSSPKRMNIEGMVEIAHELGILVDEDCEECQSANKYAKEITIQIKDVAEFKREKLRLQGEPWKKVAEVEKELCQIRRQGNIPIEKYRSQLKEKLLHLRIEQNKCDITDILTTFITGIRLLSLREKNYFLRWMKFCLDHIARENLSKLRDQYKEKCKISKDDPKMFAELDKQISASSLGVEHFMRELGQFYEAECLMIREDKLPKNRRQFTHLPGIAADLMLEGFPIELIDGDASNIPLQWVTDILTQLHAKLGGRSKMLVLTVLGVQSTGKSTLLNTMFGLQFAVSSGRCTRGAFMLLIKVAETFKQELGCDFILVIDTEGLKAPELAKLEDSYQHDNELATLVIGLSDITIVNMAMENATEMKDVLQIVVHAFLRMEKTGQKPNCQFVHQNVSDVSAHEQNMRDRKHLLEQLDEMTEAAARMEKQSREMRFTDIMDYDLEKHNWYIPGLWHGVPPMASVNVGYSEKVYELKRYLFDFLKVSSKRRSPKDIPQFIEWVKSLWNAVKHENFIFSFRNSLVADAYNQLCMKYSDWEWGFRKMMHLWLSEKETFMQNQPPDKLDSNVLIHLKTEAQLKLRQEEQKILDNLKQYFESGAANLHLIEKYKEDFKISATSLKSELENHSFNKLHDLFTNRKSQLETEVMLSKYKRKIEEKVDKLLNHCRKGHRKLNNAEQEREFENMWTQTLSELSLTRLQIRNIAADMELHLRKDLENRGSAVWQLLEGARSLPSYKTQNFKMKNEYLDFKDNSAFNIRKAISVMKEFFTQDCWNKTEALAKSLIRECNSYIEGKVNRKADYDDTYCRELLQMINKKLQQAITQNLHPTTRFEVDLKLHILGDAAHAFQKMHEEFIKENDPEQRLANLKHQYLSTFKALYSEKDKCQDRAWNFCDQCLKPALVDYMNKKLGTEIVDDFLSERSVEYSTRTFFQCFVLKQLLEENDFNNYVQYTRNYEDFIKTRIQRDLLTHYKEKAILGNLEKRVLSQIIKKLSDVLKDFKGEKTMTVSAFLDKLSEKLQQDLFIPKDSIEVILFKNTASADKFSGAIVKFIPDLKVQVLSIFESMETESKFSKLVVKPQDEFFRRVFGCGKQCPFCKAPCEAGAKVHTEHFATVHRPEGLGRYQWNETKKLVCDICSSSVGSSNLFMCTETKGEFHPYKDYRKFFPDWLIQPDSSIVASDYWKFVFKKFNHQFAKKFSALPADLPEEWSKITKEQALSSLEEAYTMKA